MRKASLLLACLLYSSASPVWAQSNEQEIVLGVPYLSMQLALDPCLGLEQGWPGDQAAMQAKTSALDALPAGLCEDSKTAGKLRHLLILRHSAVAESVEPLQAAALFEASTRELASCKSVPCVSELVDRFAPRFQAMLDQSVKGNSGQRPDFLVDGETPPNAKTWLRRYAGLMTDSNELCADSELQLIERRLSVSLPKVRVGSCFTGGPEFPVWVFLKQQGQWTLLLHSEQGSNFYLMHTVRNGYPDLHNSQRVNAGEHNEQILIHDGTKYCEAMSYTSVAAGDSGRMLAFDEPFLQSDCSATDANGLADSRNSNVPGMNHD